MVQQLLFFPRSTVRSPVPMSGSSQSSYFSCRDPIPSSSLYEHMHARIHTFSLSHM